MSIEYRICWSASSNVSFHGESDWRDWGGDPDDDMGQVEDELCKGRGGIPEGLEEALGASGFEWWVETR